MKKTFVPFNDLSRIHKPIEAGVLKNIKTIVEKNISKTFTNYNFNSKIK